MKSEYLGIEQIEKILSTEIKDWIRWGRNKSYLPPSFKCPLGFLYLPMRGDLEVTLYKPAPVNLLSVLEFEKLVVSLPTKHRQAFVMHHLSRVEINGKIVVRRCKGAESARLLGVSRTRYYTILTKAHNSIFQKWQKIQEDISKIKVQGGLQNHENNLYI